MKHIISGVTLRCGIFVLAMCIFSWSQAQDAPRQDEKAIAPGATTVSPPQARPATPIPVKAAPSSGSEHPFLRRMNQVTIDKERTREPGHTRKRVAKVPVGSETISVTLEAEPEVSNAMLDYLASNLIGARIDAATRKDIAPMAAGDSKLQKGAAEVRLQEVPGVMFMWPDGWELARPNVLRLKDGYRNGLPTAAPPSPRSRAGIGVSVAAITGSWTQINGTLQCQAPDDPAPRPLPHAGVVINGQRQMADVNGAFSFTGSFTEVNTVTVEYDGRVLPAGSLSQGPRIYVMNDFHTHRSEDITNVGGTTPPTSGILQLALPVLVSLDCELFQLGVEILQEYHNQTSANPPAGDFRIKRWEGVDTLSITDPYTPYAYHDYVVISKDFRRWADTRAMRQRKLTHEFGHTIRHAADGDIWHWTWDMVRWAYGRFHEGGNQIFNEQYAFNEGWANYWECSRAGVTDFDGCLGIDGDTPGLSTMDWNEKRVGRRLIALSASTGVGRSAMQQLLRDNPGSIHTLRDFETRFCAQFTTGTGCNAGVPTRTKTSCPPNFFDDGATCRFDNIRAKDSYGRGVGTVPTGCDENQNNAGLCYKPCRAGFDGVGPVCWKRCPAGMHDDGAFCRRDVSIVASDNSRCPWYDVCGVAVSRGCSRCRSGYQNDGCTCRRDAWIFAKESYGRGAGTIPTQCPAGKQYDAGLCYQACRNGWSGIGPVCWGSCPSGYEDHGATCYQAPNVLVKY